MTGDDSYMSRAYLSNCNFEENTADCALCVGGAMHVQVRH